MIKVLIVIFLALLALLNGTFAIEGCLRGCAASGLVSASAGHKSATLLIVNYRPGHTYYHLIVR